MSQTDIRVVRVEVRYRDVILDPPLTISGGEITRVTVAGVIADVESRNGETARGYGESVLSVLWSWPSSDSPLDERDAVLRGLVEHYAREVTATPYADPIAIWQAQVATLDEVLAKATGDAEPPVPRLAGLLALGAVDNALHDAWAKAAGRDAFSMYTDEFLSEDLSRFGLPGVYPAEGISAAPTWQLPVQHVVGVADTLEDTDEESSLAGWIAREGVDRLKIKTASTNPAVDAQRVSDVYRVGLAAGVQPRLAIDPNEGYADIDALRAMLDELALIDPEAADSISYVEQPVPRGSEVDAIALGQVSGRVPVILDEGFTSLSTLATLRADGWAGIVIKAGKGQSPAVIAAAVGHHLGLHVAVQDLTATGAAFVHSARLAARLKLTDVQLEYNSRQYAPTGNRDLALIAPDLVHVARGKVTLSDFDGVGLYGGAIE